MKEDKNEEINDKEKKSEEITEEKTVAEETQQQKKIRTKRKRKEHQPSPPTSPPTPSPSSRPPTPRPSSSLGSTPRDPLRRIRSKNVKFKTKNNQREIEKFSDSRANKITNYFNLTHRDRERSSIREGSNKSETNFTLAPGPSLDPMMDKLKGGGGGGVEN